MRALHNILAIHILHRYKQLRSDSFAAVVPRLTYMTKYPKSIRDLDKLAVVIRPTALKQALKQTCSGNWTNCSDTNIVTTKNIEPQPALEKGSGSSGTRSKPKITINFSQIINK